MPDTLKNHGRQWTLWAYQEVSYADLVEATAVEIMDLPPNAMVVDGFVEVSEANNQGTSAVCDLGVTDGTTPAPTQFTTDTDIATVAAAKFALANVAVPTGDGLKVIATATLVGGAATAGTFFVGVGYIMRNRANENQPTTFA